MDIKIFSAQHGHKKEGSLQEIVKIKNDKFNGEIWVVAGFENASKEVKRIFDTVTFILKTAFFESQTADIFERLEEILKIVNEEIADDVAALDDSVLREGGILIALFSGDVLHFTVCGIPEVYFVRKGRFTTVSDGISSQSKDGEIFTNVASGDLKDDDKIVFTTTRLLRAATGNQIADALSGGVVESIEAIKFILPEDESFSIVILHTKGVETLPFGQSKRKGFFADVAVTKSAAKTTVAKVSSEPELVIKAKSVWRKLFQSSNAQRNIAMAFAIIIALVIIASFIGSIASRNNNESNNQYKEDIAQIRKDLTSLEMRKLEGKMDEANMLIDRIESKAREIEEAGYYRVEIMEILETLGKEKDSINNITRISGANVVADLRMIDENIDIKGIFQYEGEQLVFSGSDVYKILSASGEVKSSVAIPDNEEIIKGVAFTSKSKMLFLTKSGKIVQVQDDEATFTSTSDEIFKRAVDISSFAKYMYLLDPSSNQIWKYESKDDNFSGAQGYNLDAELSDAISMTIDGNIYVLKANGEIVKLYRGEKQNYALKDIPGGTLEGVTKIYTTEELDKIYMLDQAKNRILVFSKGENESYYKGQIIVENTSNIKDFWVNPTTKRLFLVDQSKIYEILDSNT